MSQKFSDQFIRDLTGPVTGDKASIRFTCGNRTTYFKDCEWSATKNLEKSSPCVTSYADENATELKNNLACGAGSQALGSNCNGEGVATYCSHCDGGDSTNGAPEITYNRKGCGHNDFGYGHSGKVWVRGGHAGVRQCSTEDLIVFSGMTNIDFTSSVKLENNENKCSQMKV